MANFSKFSAIVNGAQRTVDLSASGNVLELGGAGLQMDGSTSGHVVINASATTSTYSMVWPPAQSVGSSYVLTNDGTGVLSWSAPSATGANTALSNLSAVAINTALLPGVNNSIALGSSSFIWSTVWAGSLAFPSGPAISLASGYMTDSSGAHKLDWVNGNLADSAGTTQLNWSTSGVAFSQLTATTVPYLNASKILTSSAVTPTELGYLSGVTSSIQTQLNTILAGHSWKDAVLLATTANITLSGEQTIDGVLTSTSRVLVKNQTTNTQNGIYTTASGAWTRTSDFNTWTSIPGSAVVVQEGSVNGDLGFLCTAAPGGTVGTSAITFVQFTTAGSYSADGTTLQLIGGVFSVKNGGIGSTQLASAAVAPANLGNVTDGVTLDQSGSGSTLEIKAAGVSATQLASGAFDQLTITGGAGTAASVQRAPALKRTLVAGQTFTANTSYAVRWGLTANGETANRVYAADITTSSFDLFYVIGMASSAAGAVAGGNITVTTLGSFNLGSSDTAFASSTDGAPVFLTASGTFSVTAPTTSGQALTRIGMVQVRSATNTSCIIDVLPQVVGVN